MALRETTHVTFTIESPKLTAAELEQRLGLKPDVSWTAGAVRGAFGARAKNHGFVLESTLSPNEGLERHLGEMLKRLAPYAQKIGALGPELDIELLATLHRKAAPAVDVKRDDLRWLGVMGARLRLDTQLLAEKAAPGAAAPGAKPDSK